MAAPGRATEEGTARYAARHAETAGAGHFRRAKRLSWSSIGIGTYLGAGDDATDADVTAAVEAVLAGGVNVIDTAANYRRERGEKSVGAALEKAFAAGTVARDEVIVCTKGGYLPHGAQWFSSEFVGQGAITADDLVGGSHCMHPDYLSQQLDRSLENLGLETIDVYYLHNPESQVGKVGPEIFEARLEAAFRMLEGAVAAGSRSADRGFRAQVRRPAGPGICTVSPTNAASASTPRRPAATRR
ncbi:MAG: aldo/keto reductase [Magnetovibrio sp.]|nr:aldo/keto reductase [Magnetovibrio sp.]